MLHPHISSHLTYFLLNYFSNGNIHTILTDKHDKYTLNSVTIDGLLYLLCYYIFEWLMEPLLGECSYSVDLRFNEWKEQNFDKIIHVIPIQKQKLFW